MSGLRSIIVALFIGQGLVFWWFSGQSGPVLPGAEPTKTDATAKNGVRATNTATSGGATVVWDARSPHGKFWGNDAKHIISLDGTGVDGKGKAITLRFEGEGWRGCGLNWKGWFPEDACDDLSRFRSLVFYIRQTTNVADADLTVHLTDNRKRKIQGPVSNPLSILNAGGISRIDDEWRKVVIPLEKFSRNAELDLSRVWQIDFVNSSGKTIVFQVDRIGFSGECVMMQKFIQGESYNAVAAVDLMTKPYPIREEIYGVCDLPREQLTAYGIKISRWGGNRSSRFNWQENADNAGKDWYYRNAGLRLDNPAQGGWNKFVRERNSVGSASFITAPMLGWVSKDRHSYGYSVKKYGPQRGVELGHPDVGNGIRPDGSMITKNDPTDTSIAVDAPFIAEGVRLVVQTTGRADAGRGGPRYWALDNEPMLWHETHRDVQQRPLGYDELWDRTVRYAEAIRAADPGAKIAGFTSWGWTDLFYSAADEGGNNYASKPDFHAHGGVPLAEWFIRKCGEYKRANGRPLVDTFDFHWYPQAQVEGRGPYLGTGMDLKFNQLRMRTTRDLWDPNYVNESWVKDTGDQKPTRLLRRVREWIDKHNPGMEICVGEYNFGGADNITGGLAQADVLGILGRERADLAFIWTHPEGTQELAWKLFRNYDGAGGRFGDQAVPVECANQDLGVFAAKRSKDGATTIAVVNKNLTGACQFKLAVPSLKGRMRAWRFDQETNCQVVEVSGAAREVDGTITMTLPAASATMVVIE